METTAEGYKNACQVLDRLSDAEVEMTWKTLQEVGVDENMDYNGVSGEDWCQLVYNERDRRRTK